MGRGSKAPGQSGRRTSLNLPHWDGQKCGQSYAYMCDEIDDLVNGDSLLVVAEDVEGMDEVVEQLQVRGLG